MAALSVNGLIERIELLLHNLTVTEYFALTSEIPGMYRINKTPKYIRRTPCSGL